MAEADPKRSDESSASNDVEIEDTATSKNPKKEAIEVEIDNINIMETILAYKERVGVYPCDNPVVFKRFCYTYVRMGIGNTEGWIKKVNEIKNKFNNWNAPMRNVDKKEFELWKKIWGNERKGNGDPGAGSSK